ncbi:MAG TPA: hypothetical protein ENK66_06445, partial [Arcobacter sp.]|nr:hypothetical protein [Arcobacter sp.]
DMITNGKLCVPFALMNKEKNLEDNNLGATLQTLVEKLKEPDKKVLYYKGYGHMGVMQNIPKHFFNKIGATIATGSTCDEAGEAGIVMGRHCNVNPDIEDLLHSDVIIVWGKNFTVTSNHIYNMVQDKTFITIDPNRTKIASLSDTFLQIKPKGDFVLASCILKYIQTNEIDEDTLGSINIKKRDFLLLVDALQNKKVSVMLGIGAQKYKEGAQIFHQIDKVFEVLGFYKGRNDKVWYIGNGRYRFNDVINKIDVQNTCEYADINFDKYDIVFIQAANPIITAMNSNRIKKELKNTYVIVMGTRDDETVKFADLIIPAKTYLQKKDVRLAYSHDEINEFEVCEETNNAISEYELTQFLFDAFGLDGLLNEDEYLSHYKKTIREKPQKLEFTNHNFDEVESLELKENEAYFLTSKTNKNLNSQFNADEYCYVHPSLNFNDDELISLKSDITEITLRVKNDETVFPNAVLCYAGNKKINQIIPNIVSDYGANGSFQDFIIKVNKVV